MFLLLYNPKINPAYAFLEALVARAQGDEPETPDFYEFLVLGIKACGVR